MTPRQAERIKKKIADIRKILAAERKKFGGYDDSYGRRYLPPRYYIELEDYKGGLIYLRWFQRNFPDDSGMPGFLFELSLILFQTGKLKEAERMVFRTFCRDPFIFEDFFEAPVLSLPDRDSLRSKPGQPVGTLGYSARDPRFAAFTAWLQEVFAKERFRQFSGRFIEIELLLEHTGVSPERSRLIDERYSLRHKY